MQKTGNDVDNAIETLQGYKKYLPPAFVDSMALLTISSYDDFVTFINTSIDKSIKEVQRNPQHLYHDKSLISEEAITDRILASMRAIGINASAETNNGGHCDIDITHNDYKWLGEAKKHKDYDYLFKGLDQLLTRYSTGIPNEDCGGLVVYIKNKNGCNVLETFKTKLTTNGYSVSQCTINKLSILASTSHERTGLQYTVRVIPVFLYYNPKV